MRLFSIFISTAVAAFCAVSPVLAQSPAQNGVALATALEAVAKDDWEQAARIAQGNHDPLAAEIVEWHRLRAGGGGFADYARFLSENSDWPGLALLQKESEHVMPAGLPAAQVIQYFQTRPPQTGRGVLLLALAYQQSGQQNAANGVVTRAWTGMLLTTTEQNALWKAFSGTLKAHNATRLDWLLWRSRLTEGSRMLGLVSADQRKLAEVRIALQRNKNGVDAMIKALPRTLRDNAGLAYDRFRWRIGKDYWDSAAEMLVARSASREKLGRPEFWSNKRRTYARRAMRAGDNRTAYLLASQHFLTPDQAGYKDLEWLAGFLALRKLNDPARAVVHFQKFRASVMSPISVGRAGYWLGRSYEALGESANARTFYALGAQYQTSFYGQLAAERGGLPADSGITGSGSFDWTNQNFLQQDSVRAAFLFHHASQDLLTRRFLSHASESLDLRARGAIGQLALDLDLPNTALKIAKLAARNGDVIQHAYYPLIPLAHFKSPVPAELAMSIARQESELHTIAQSSVGALGLMQVMPATAKSVAKGLGLPYSKARLATDWEYNATLGTAYLAQMLVRYNGSYVLAAAAYNAGPHRADRWIRDYGDPRRTDVDVIDWIETIPFRETRNYVMRVNEALFTYRARISGRTPKMQLTHELKRGG